MRTHTIYYKNAIKLNGRQTKTKITYTINNEDIELGKTELNSVSLHYEGDILKSVMKQLDLDSNIDIPLNTILTCQFGVKIGNEYEYINFGNFVVFSSEKQENEKAYRITCYDKMLYSMKDYETMNITYPITIRDYINAIATHLGLEFANNNEIFANYNRNIQSELYLDSEGNSLNYTFRDVLDELAQVTASTICINENDELEIRYITNTNDKIDENYFKDTNVNIGEKYGPVNTIVLSRSANADNIYYPNVLPENPIEIKITDNQIMNFNDRADYMPDIYAKLNGLEYYLNDFSSTGITYYELCDKYNVQIGDEVYPCIMFNDDINITTGLEEYIYTDMPKEGETDYTKADKTDRKINQTYLLVDKQNQVITSVINNVSEQNNKISEITQTVDEINQKIGEITGITVSGESNEGNVLLEGVNASEPITIKVRPLNATNNISYLYPYDNLYPSSSLYPKSRTIRFIRTYIEEGVTKTESIDYELPDDLLYYDSTHYDEFYLNYDSNTCQITKRCKYNADGSIGLLSQETIITYPYPTINLEDGDYEVQLLGYNVGYLFVTLMASNIYTTQFATRVEMTSAINQTASEINATVSLKLDEEEYTHASIVAKINDNTSQIKIDADKIDINATDVINILAGNTINLTSKSIAITSNNFSVDTSGNLRCSNATISGTLTAGSGSSIGGWTATNTLLYSGSGSSYVALSSSTSDTYSMWAGNSNANSAPFRVSRAGSLYASGMTIAGSSTISGTLTGGTISGSAINGGSISISKNNNAYYFNMGVTTSHPNCSGLNVGSGGINVNGLGFNSNGSAFTFSSQINVPVLYASSYLTTNRIEANGSVNIHSGGNDGSYANNGGIYMATGQVSGTPSHITLNADPGRGLVYAEGYGTVRGRVAIDSSGPSSRCLKKDIKDYKSEEYDEALKLLNEIKIYNYKYKYKIHDKENQYGFIIDDLLENELADKFLYFKDETAGIMKNGRFDYSANNEDNPNNLEIIDFKRYDEETLIKYLLVVCKALQNKIEKLEKEK